MNGPTLRPASWLWLLRHEIRLAVRGTVSTRFWVLAVFVGLGWAGLHVVAWMALRELDTRSLRPATVSLLAGAVWVVFTLALAQAITFSIEVLFDRGDLDLLLASPLAPAHVFAARGLGVAITSIALYAVLLVPFAHVGPFTGNANLLAIYPALAGLALLAAAIGMTLTIVLVRLLGARRARTAAHLLGAFVGAFFFLAMQAGNLVGDDRLLRWLRGLDRPHGQDAGRFDLLAWPVQALLGQPLALASLLVLGLGGFAAVVALTARRFLAGTQEPLSGPAEAAGRPGRPLRPFRTRLWRIVLVKEWKLIGRDPQLIAHTFLQTLYFLPIVLIAFRQGSVAAMLAPGAVLVTSTLASGLAWLAIAAEDAPELIDAAPVSRPLVRRLKLLAALAPVWLLSTPLIVVVALDDGLAAAVLAACIAGASISSGVVQMAMSRPGDRKNLKRRGKGNYGASAIELEVSLAWSVLAWTLLAMPLYAPLPALAALAGPLLAVWIGRGRTDGVRRR